MSVRGLWAAAAGSFLLHAAAMLALVIGPALRIAPPPIPIEVRQVRRVAPRPPPAAPSPPASAKPKPRPGAGASPKVAKPTPPKPPAPPAPPAPPQPPQPPMTADLSQFAPGDAHIQILLRTDRMRSSPHRGAVEYLLHHLPDYDTLVTGSTLAPFDDLDALLIATSNPLDVTATFLAARHAADGRARSLLAERKLPSWDPRTLRFPEPTLTLLARPDSRPPIQRADGGTDEDPDVLEARWLRNLSHFERAAGDKNGPALLVDIEQLDALVHLPGSLPTPLALTVAATPAAAPLVRIRMQFAGEPEARFFAELLPETKRKIVEWRPLPFLPALGTTIPLAPLLDALKPQVSGSVVELVGELPAEPFARVLAWVPRLLPHQPVATASADLPSTASPSTYGSATPSGAAPPSTTGVAPLSPSANQGGASPAGSTAPPPPVGLPGVMSRPSPIPPPPDSTPGPAAPAPPPSPAAPSTGPTVSPAPPAAPRPAAPRPAGGRSDAGTRS